MENLTNNEIEAARKLRDFLHFENDDELLQNDFDNDYLTVNGSRDDKDIWYYDENYNAAIDVETLEIIDDVEVINKLFMID